MANAQVPRPPFAWQAAVWKDFCGRAAESRVPHAILLYGQAGIGVEALAMAMAQYLLCQTPVADLACGKCRGCTLIDADTHPDLFYLYPEETGKPIKVDQVRELSGFVAKTAQHEGGYKVVLLQPAEVMNLNAANALLKNLEEPAGKTVFILVSREISRLLPTIRSRCVIFSLPLPPQELATAWLAGQGLGDATALLAGAGGAPLLAAQWQREGRFEERLQLTTAMANIALGNTEPMTVARQWSKQEPPMLVELMLVNIEALIACVMGKRPLGTHQILLQPLVQRVSTATLFQLRDRLCIKKRQLLTQANLNPALVIEELVLEWSSLAGPVSVGVVKMPPN